MKTLSVFRTEEGIIVERKNEFGTIFKSIFETTTGMLENLEVYKNTGKLDEYELDVSNEFWAIVINFINTGEMPTAKPFNKLLVLHKKMYDTRWNGAAGDSDQLEKEFMSFADREGVDLEKVNEMLNQLYIPPYNVDMLPEHLKSNHGGKREGAGRPSLGTTKKVSLTLPDEIWDMVEERKKDLEVSQSQTLRMMIEEFFYNSANSIHDNELEEAILVQRDLVNEIRELSQETDEIYENQDTEDMVHNILNAERLRLKKESAK